MTLKEFHYGAVDMQTLDRATPIPFPFPLRHGFNYVYTLDLDEGHLTISFWHNEEDDESPDTMLCMRRRDLDDIWGQKDLEEMITLLHNGCNPLLELSAKDSSSQTGKTECQYKFENWEIKIDQPSSLNELQYRLFTDFVYQWRFFIDDCTIWATSSSTLFRRLSWAFLRIAAWDLEISIEEEKAKLPLGAEDFPAWGSPQGQIYWFHGRLVVLCQNLGRDGIAEGVVRVKGFLGKGEVTQEVDCIFISLEHIAFLKLSGERKRCSRISPFLTETSAKEYSPGFRVLTSLLTPSHNNRAAREKSHLKLPNELLDLVLDKVPAYDLISFAQASFMIEEWYYSPSSLPQLPGIKILHHEISIPCCGEREGGAGVYCSTCYIWLHLGCMSSSEATTEPYTCPSCLLLSLSIASSPEQKAKHLEPGAISRQNRGSRRRKGAHVHRANPTEEKILQLRTTSPAVQRPELRMMDRDLSSTPLNEIDYVVLFGGVWTGLAYGLDDLDPVAG